MSALTNRECIRNIEEEGMMSYKTILSLACLVLASLTQTAWAQTLIIDSAIARGTRPVDIPVRFEAGSVDVVAFAIDVVYDNRIFAEPTCAFSAPLPGGCAVHHGNGFVRFGVLSSFPLRTDTYGTIQLRSLGRLGTPPVTLLGASGIQVIERSSELVDFTIYTGQIQLR